MNFFGIFVGDMLPKPVFYPPCPKTARNKNKKMCVFVTFA
jgi:hypothetical protein